MVYAEGRKGVDGKKVNRERKKGAEKEKNGRTRDRDKIQRVNDD